MDILWLSLASMLVFLMQAGFLCLETGFVRSKNSINVAAKNLADFAVSSAIFWVLGFAIMFGDSYGGWFGTSDFFFGADADSVVIAIFLFQMMFCGTAATLVSGAVAERMAFSSYLVVTVIITSLIYPVVGHWAWAGIIRGEAIGWLEQLGFVDFAGATVVHSVGGWVALAAVLVIGPRSGRFDTAGKRIPSSNLPLAVLGCLLIWFGWFGFNGGSTLGWTEAVPGILLNTCLAAVWAGIVATALSYHREGFADVTQIVNGILGGLVSITASCHAVSPATAAIIGAIGGGLVYLGDRWLQRLQIDDSIGVIPVHLFAGIWGTLAVGLFGDAQTLATGLSASRQLGVQLVGILAAGGYSFFVAYLVLRLIDSRHSLRVDAAAEAMGLNVAEHHVSTEVFDLLSAMQEQQQRADFSAQVPVEPFTEVGQIAQQYNLVIDKVDREIKKRDRAFQAFKQSEYRKGAILDAAMDCIVTIDMNAEILEFNPAAEQCFGVSKREVIARDFFALFMPEEKRRDVAQSLAQGFTQSEGLVLKRTNVTNLNRSDGQSFPAEMVITLTTDAGDPRKEYTLHVRDITQQNKLQDRLRFLAYRDALTGLHNRSYLVQKLNQRIALYKESPGSVVVMFMDLDNFKKVNDTLGHKAGDELLLEVSRRLNRVVRDVDLAGRWGGDEFVIVLSGNINKATAVARAKSVLQIMRQPVVINQHTLNILASIGVAISDNGSVSGERLLQHADLAMYKAKQGGRNTYRMFTPDMEAKAQHQFQLELALPKAMQDNQLHLHYQPKVCCSNNEIIGYEALLRWQHPEQGAIPPGDFIPLIEESSLIIDIGEWVLDSVMQQLVAWRELGIKLLPVAVNLSGRHLFSPNLTPFIQSLAEKYRLPTGLLEIEITEGVLVADTDESIAALSRLQALDIKLSIDDFGTGYSSLSYLKRFPIDVLKIDRAFVDDCFSNTEDGAICIAIIAVARSIGLETVAEGVENEEQLEFLKQHGCESFQGYWYSRPVPADCIPALLQRQAEAKDAEFAALESA